MMRVNRNAPAVLDEPRFNRNVRVNAACGIGIMTGAAMNAMIALFYSINNIYIK
jgi:hypothetical protein